MSMEDRGALVAIFGEWLTAYIDNSTEHMRGLLSIQLCILTRCLANPRWKELAVVQSLGDLDIDSYDSDSHRAVTRLYDKASDNYDPSCSRGHTALLHYTLHVARYCADAERDQKRADAKRTLADLERQRLALLAAIEEASDE